MWHFFRTLCTVHKKIWKRKKLKIFFYKKVLDMRDFSSNFLTYLFYFKLAVNLDVDTFF
jgi:hypothetical protein